MLDLDVIEARAEAATPGPWRNEPDTGAGRVWVQRGYFRDEADCEPLFSLRGKEAYEQRSADADFIAHARTDIPNLLAALDELEAENKELKLDLAAAEHYTTDDLTSPARLCVKCRRPWPCEFTSVQVGKNRTMERTA